MSKPRKPVSDELYKAVVKSDFEKTRKLAETIINHGVSANDQPR